MTDAQESHAVGTPDQTAGTGAPAERPAPDQPSPAAQPSPADRRSYGDDAVDDAMTRLDATADRSPPEALEGYAAVHDRLVAILGESTTADPAAAASGQGT